MTDILFQEPEFTDQPLDANKDYLTELVGEGKKFSDPQALARGKFEADQFVERLKQENAGLRNELNSRVKMEEFLDKLNSSNQPPQSPDAGQQPPDPAKAETKGLTPEQVLQLLEQREQRKNAETNVNKVKERLQDTLGPNYTSKLKQVTSELGLSTEHLTNLASTSPDAFYKLVGIDGTKKPEPFQSPPRNQLMTGFTPSNSIRDWNYYQDIKKKEPTKYWTPAVQNQMHADAHRLGEKFKQS